MQGCNVRLSRAAYNEEPPAFTLATKDTVRLGMIAASLKSTLIDCLFHKDSAGPSASMLDQTTPIPWMTTMSSAFWATMKLKDTWQKLSLMIDDARRTSEFLDEEYRYSPVDGIIEFKFT